MDNVLAWTLFDLVFRPWMKRRIAGVKITGLPRVDEPDQPVLLCPNHVSWWDGFVARDVARLLRPDAPFRALLLERELEAHPVLRPLGGVGVRPGSVASVRGAVRRVEALLRSDRRTVFTVFPQGRIWPADRRPLGFRPGIRLFRRVGGPCWTVPVGIRLEPLADPRPTVFVSVGRPLGSDVPEGELVKRLEARVAAELDALSWFLSLHGEDAVRAWPGPDGRLPHRPPVGEGERGLRRGRSRPEPWPSLN
ncbi:MAG: lysophospholipid acyltransferase family protein [Gemmatimonadota bacterium]|jgi:1-acyl-sn-glycerol-3-phosphate acyltransferase